MLVLAALAFWTIRPGLHNEDVWQNPLAAARFARLTDFEGSELDAAISQDGRFVTFLSNRDGPFDGWVGQIGSGSAKLLRLRIKTGLFSSSTRPPGVISVSR